ncbi:MAG: ACT domain-containing protein [Deltaproteobacteria bacterium]|nr:MAG: ACT domain-containing protein [Deltaproteobacteria bacterium]
MSKIKLRGLKLLEGGAQVVSTSPGDDNFLATGVCSPLALNKINLTFLNHVASDGSGSCITAICTEGSAGRAAASLIEARQGRGATVELHKDVSTVSVFTHDQRPQVAGGLLEVLARRKITLQAMASSPSAVSAVVSSADTEKTIGALFDAFEFPAYRSPSDWYGAYEGKEHLLRKIIASYQEKVIRIYDIVQQSELDLWSLAVDLSEVGDLGAALVALGRMGIRMPFIIALPSPENRMVFNFCFPGGQDAPIREGLSSWFGNTSSARQSRVAVLYIHGPHFGDRYGIAHTLVKALENRGVSLLSMGCTVSSISTTIREQDLAAAIRALESTFNRSSA